MSSGTEEPNLFLRKEYESEAYNEDWDDGDLIAAYDKAVSTVKRQITRKIQKELGLKDEDVQEFLSDSGSSSSKSKKTGKGYKKRGERKKWRIGSSCRAVYSEDGEEYEAVIVKIIDKHSCVVRYVGYDNEEEVKLKGLTPSLGKNIVQIQIEAANKQEDEDEGDDEEEEEEEGHQDEVPKDQVRQGFVTEENHSQPSRTREPMMRRLPMSFSVPPPPPALPALSKDLIKKQNDINSMLMSWYMCGYYTGLYERGQQLENN